MFVDLHADKAEITNHLLFKRRSKSANICEKNLRYLRENRLLLGFFTKKQAVKTCFQKLIYNE